MEPPKWGGEAGRDARRAVGMKCRGAVGLKENGGGGGSFL